MERKYKFIIAILVFMGFFSSVQAVQYANNDMLQEKTVLDTVTLSSDLDKEKDKDEDSKPKPHIPKPRPSA